MRDMHAQRVARIRTEYVQSREVVEKRKRKRVRGLIRRLVAFTAVFTAAIVLMLTSIFSQADRLDAASKKKAQLERQLDVSTKDAGHLKKQITLLHDKAYIGEIARRDLYLSGEGEIIFSDPAVDND